MLLCNNPQPPQGCWVIGDVDDYTHEYRMYIDAVRLGEGSSSGAGSLLMEGGELWEGRGEGQRVKGKGMTLRSDEGGEGQTFRNKSRGEGGEGQQRTTRA